MVDIGIKLRQAYYDALNGNIVYGGSEIPIVDEKLDVNISEHDIYVLMLSQTEDLQSGQIKDKWVNECLLTMRIINQRKATNTKEIVEDVAGQILAIIKPTRSTEGISLSAPLSLTYANYVNGFYEPLQKNEVGFIISKSLTFKNRVVQN